MKKINIQATGLSILLLLVCLPLLAQTQTPATEFDGVFEKVLYSKGLNENRSVYIYIPDKKGPYPVLYLLDAQSTDLFREAYNYTRMSEEVGPHIIVGIVTSGSRNRDMIPAVVENRPGSGGAANFLKFLTDELQTYVNKKFNTSGLNILYGGSNAGLFTVYAMLEHPEAFTGFISSSTMIGHCSEFMEEKARQMDPARLDGKYLYIHYGLNGEYEGALAYIPDYYDLLTSRFGDLMSDIRAEKNGGHVPVGGIACGLDFIYSD